MRLCVVGTGYVGLVAGVCFSDTGQFVTCVDTDEEKVGLLSAGTPTIYEPGLEELLKRNLDAGRLIFTTDLAGALSECNIVFIAVGTPPREDGSPDLSAVDAVAHAIAKHATGPKIVVTKSTVPVGTHKRVGKIFADESAVGIDYVSNPEFLKEGSAIDDFSKPDRVIIGAENPQAAKTIAHLYKPFMRLKDRIIITDPATAEMAKYAANTMLAMRITFMNEIARLCDHYGADVAGVRRCVGSDSRIGPSFLFPGIGYGGSCFPKDVQAVVSMGQAADCPMDIARATHEANLKQPEYFKTVIDRHFKGRYEGRRIAVWGLAYKARTDDTRMSPALVVAQWLVDKGARLVVHDPKAMQKASEQLGDMVEYSADMYGMLDDGDALLVLTDWPEFRNPDFDRIRDSLKTPVVIDGRNLYEPDEMKEAGFTYLSVGRPMV